MMKTVCRVTLLVAATSTMLNPSRADTNDLYRTLRGKWVLIHPGTLVLGGPEKAKLARKGDWFKIEYDTFRYTWIDSEDGEARLRDGTGADASDIEVTYRGKIKCNYRVIMLNSTKLELQAVGKSSKACASGTFEKPEKQPGG